MNVSWRIFKKILPTTEFPTSRRSLQGIYASYFLSWNTDMMNLYPRYFHCANLVIFFRSKRVGEWLNQYPLPAGNITAVTSFRSGRTSYSQHANSKRRLLENWRSWEEYTTGDLFCCNFASSFKLRGRIPMFEQLFSNTPAGTFLRCVWSDDSHQVGDRSEAGKYLVPLKSRRSL